MKEHISVKEILIKFMEYQMENKPLIANFTHNAVANNFLEELNLSPNSASCPHRNMTIEVCDECGLTNIQIKEGFINWLNKVID